MINTPFGKRFKMPPRGPDDEDVRVTVICDAHYKIEVGEQTIALSEHEAATLFGCLSLFLNVRLSKRDGKALTLASAKSMEFNLELRRY